MKRFGAKAYYIKMLLWIGVAILLIVVVLSAVVYFNARKLLVKNEYASNQKILYQVKYNMAFMDQSIASLCQSLYLNSDVAAVMYARQENMVEVANRLNKVTSAVTSANPYIHSLTIYNRNLDQTYNAGRPLFFEDKLLSALYDSDRLLPQMKPIFRNIEKLVNGKTEPEYVFSYVMYETSADDLKPDGVIIVNVRSKWLLDNINQINMIDERKGDSIFIMDQAGEYLDDGTGDREIMQRLKGDLAAYRAAHPEADEEGFFSTQVRRQAVFNHVYERRRRWDDAAQNAAGPRSIPIDRQAADQHSAHYLDRPAAGARRLDPHLPDDLPADRQFGERREAKQAGQIGRDRSRRRRRDFILEYGLSKIDGRAAYLLPGKRPV
ncbi:hypothetical protein [Cohnella rhizosphaerae]|uniref:Cache domain-containing protein n=1 Tax=Cohnella rhizosphaerae TaxID=1457232 RepID=A0A9X4QX60_9BACL|nr:hypothetical protein [Cohnella rhizosphaerae]MDG0814258.1 cache domain-containing protein [Cohnella rhizosphaerae]